MIDVLTRAPLTVSDGGQYGPYMQLAYSQLDEVRRAFDAAGIAYDVADQVFSFDGGPKIASIHFGRKGDIRAIQSALDTR